MSVGENDRAVIDVSRLEGGDGHHLEAGAGREDVTHLCPAKFNDGDLGGDRHHVGHRDKVRNITL